MTTHPNARRHGLTLVEMLVTTMIIGILAAVSVPALNKARETTRGAACRQNLHNIAVAARTYSQTHGNYPPGVRQVLFPTAPIYRGTSLFAYLLPYVDQDAVARRWNYDDPLKNTDGGSAALTAVVVPNWLCPSDDMQNRLANDGRWIYALSSYGGNGGTRSYFPGVATVDGMFHTTGPASEPQPHQRPVSEAEVRDGIERTILFGERTHRDVNYEGYAASGGGPTLAAWGWWAAAGGRRSIGHVALGASAPINYRHPFPGNLPPQADAAYYSDLRLTAFGSNHPGGSNFAYVGGAVEFHNDEMSLTVLQSLGTRAGDYQAP